MIKHYNYTEADLDYLIDYVAELYSQDPYDSIVLYPISKNK